MSEGVSLQPWQFRIAIRTLQVGLIGGGSGQFHRISGHFWKEFELINQRKSQITDLMYSSSQQIFQSVWKGLAFLEGKINSPPCRSAWAKFRIQQFGKVLDQFHTLTTVFFILHIVCMVRNKLEWALELCWNVYLDVGGLRKSLQPAFEQGSSKHIL